MIFDRLLAVAASAPETSGLRQGDAFQSYAALVQRIERLAAGLSSRGLAEGAVVGLLIPNSIEIFVVAYALFAIGAIVMPLDPQATRAELAGLTRRTGMAAVIATPASRATGELLLKDTAPAGQLLITTELGAVQGSPMRLPKLQGSTPALYLFSSGSTGLPKIVPHTHAEVLADGARTSQAWNLQPDDIVINILPPNFAMGFLLGVIDTVYRGATTLYWSNPLPLALARRNLLEAMVAHRVTVMGAVPAMYELIAAQKGAFDLRLRHAFSGGAALKRPVFEAVRNQFGIALRQAYGSTEAIFVSQNDAPDPDASWASVGRPAGDAEVRIVPVDASLGDGVGELQIRSSSLMQGYLDGPAVNADAFEDGWFRSGDLASLDEEGRITIRGRSKLLIEVSGFKVDPIEVEDTLGGHPAVVELAVAAVPDTRAGNRLRAYIVKKSDVSEDELIRFARDRLSSHKVPSEIAFVDALPRSPTGKLLRSKLVGL
jgi:long-chain acyl-CoA synthetase